ncbi:MAG: VIT1/CCC1 transporter family protein [Candidatus Omnitrophica bacterium]|nr:VIT1/CCC1 transporter family protein [Candidatus Omnitrophota bacterium]MCF7877349.1 VIT1/CCC1 transporter family protein [Candidatus Omnitrophota bacterium]MCF7892453.1 VIT1/CCC1 transporter family protein [Candidatus Omnitrophota bacterium]MCF7895452.1 VIT1/CCC1 transporter family protein [Candidatus Omnitrophota bacterium]MCF7897832.1 VIT1/CCC1 transporter family protein [Candidatus Omnitrophota bacterium]
MIHKGINLIRYLNRGLIDGSLSVMGVIIGAFNPNIELIISAGLAGALANAASNLIAAFSAEQATGYKYLKDLEEDLLIDLRNTGKEKEIKRKIKKSALTDGISTLLGGVIPLLPFFLLKAKQALMASIIVTLLLFVVLGVYYGRLSKKNIIISGLKMAFIALVTAGVCFLIRILIK